MDIKWNLKRYQIADLKEWKKNPRKLTEKGIKDLTNSIEKFGVAEPIVINLDKTICGGHGRKKVLVQMGIKEVDCYEPNRLLTDKEFEELNIRLNKNQAGTFDFDILANEFEIDDLLDWGFEEKELGIFDTGLSGESAAVNKGDENSEWVDMPEFEAGDKDIKIVIHFKTELEREIYAKENNITEKRVQSGQWIVHK